MTHIRLVVGMNVAGGFHERDDLVLVDDDVAARLVDLGRAELIEARVERAVRVAPETAARTTARSRIRAGRPTVETRGG